MEVKTNIFASGIVNNPKDPELVPRGGASDSLGWITRGGFIELSRGKMIVGPEETANGSVKGHHFGYTTTGEAVHFRKVNTRIQFYNDKTNRLRGDFALSFDGTDDYVDCGNNASLNLTNNFTFVAWIKTTTTTGTKRIIGKAGSYAFGQANAKLLFTTLGVQDYFTTNNQLTADTWYHVAVVFDSSNDANFYVNGSFVETVAGTTPATVTANTFRIGQSGSNSEYWNGKIKNVRVFNTALTAAQIAALYNNSNIPTSNLVSHWKFDEGSGTTATDSAGSNTGTLTNGPTYTTNRPTYNNDTWVDVITGLTDSEQYTFANHQSLTGSFTYASGIDGLYKINLVKPADYITLTDAVKNFSKPGKILISDSRMFMWGLPKDKTGLYLSYIDAAVYTTVTGEALGGPGSQTYSGTLAFKAGGAKRNAFAVVISAAGGESFTDNNDGTMTGSSGGTGTVNYTTGAYSVTFNAVTAAAVTADYQWEDSTNKGLADFTYTTPDRKAAEGDLFRQDDGGDAIQKVEVFDGVYYSLKEHSVYELTLTADDTNATNKVYRRNIGMPYFRASVSTGQGVVFMDTADPDHPKLTRLERNLTGDGILPIELAPQFDFSLYEWDQCAMDAIGEYIIFSGRTEDSPTNNRVFLYSLRWKSIDVLAFNAATFAKNEGLCYIGDMITDSVYNLFSGYDDDGFDVENEWISGADLLDTEEYKRVKRLTLEGEIMREQDIEVYISLDNDDFELLGTIEGVGSYVELENSHTIGSVGLGIDEIGGGGSGIDIYPYFVEFKINTGKFYRRRLKFKATGIGYASVSMIKDKDIYQYGDKIPRKYRTN